VQLKLEEKSMEKDTSIRSNAMGAVPFQLGEDLTQKLGAFSGASSDIAWLEMLIDLSTEKVQLGRTRSTPLAEADIPSVRSHVPSFLNNTVFLCHFRMIMTSFSFAPALPPGAREVLHPQKYPKELLVFRLFLSRLGSYP